MSRSLPSRLLVLSFGLCLALALLLGAGVRQARCREGAKAAPKPGPVVEVSIKEEAPPAKPVSLTLDPFFLIEEDTHRVRVRRVGVALEFSQPEMLKKIDPQTPGLRELVYDFLSAKERDYSGLETEEQQNILAGLINRCLGQEAVTAVKVDQSILLLR
jgi:hypothetical protein